MVENRSSLSMAKISRRTLSLAAVAMAATACGGGSGGSDIPSAPPRFTVQPADVSVTAGAQATFRVAVESSESVTYQWLRDGNAIAGATSAEYSVAAAALADQGARFSVTARNSAGSVESNKAMLTVTPVANPGNIALAGGVLASIDARHWFVSYAKSGDVFIWERDNRRMVRYNAGGSRIPFAGSLQELQLGNGDAWQPSMSVVEHSDGNLYVSVGYLGSSGRINSYSAVGGYIYRVTPQGIVSVVYNTQTNNVSITPHKLVEGPNGQLYTVHLNTVSLYRLTTSGGISKVADLTTTPITDQSVVLRYTPYISLVATDSRTVYVSCALGNGFDYRVSAADDLVPVTYGSGGARHLATAGESIFAYTVTPGQFPTVVQRDSDTASTVIAGGIKAPVQGEAGFGEPAGLGPLPGWIPSFTQVFAAAPGGRIVMGGRSEESGGYVAPYFVLTPPGQ